MKTMQGPSVLEYNNNNNSNMNHGASSPSQHEDSGRLIKVSPMSRSKERGDAACFDLKAAKRDEKLSKSKKVEQEESPEDDGAAPKEKISSRRKKKSSADNNNSDGEIDLLERQLQEMKAGRDEPVMDDEDTSHQVSVASSRAAAKWNSLKGTARFGADDFKSTNAVRPSEYLGSSMGSSTRGIVVPEKRKSSRTRHEMNSDLSLSDLVAGRETFDKKDSVRRDAVRQAAAAMTATEPAAKVEQSDSSSSSQQQDNNNLTSRMSFPATGDGEMVFFLPVVNNKQTLTKPETTKVTEGFSDSFRSVESTQSSSSSDPSLTSRDSAPSKKKIMTPVVGRRPSITTTSASSGGGATMMTMAPVVNRRPSMSSSTVSSSALGETCGEFVRPDEFVGAGWKNTPGFTPLKQQERRRPRKKEETSSDLSLVALVSARDQHKKQEKSCEDSLNMSLDLGQVVIDPTQPHDSCSSSFRSATGDHHTHTHNHNNNSSSRNNNNDDSFFSARSTLEESAKHGGAFSLSFGTLDEEEDDVHADVSSSNNNNHHEDFSNSFKSAQSHTSSESSSGRIKSSSKKAAPKVSKPTTTAPVSPSIANRPDEFLGADNWNTTPGYTPIKKAHRGNKKVETTGLPSVSLVAAERDQLQATAKKTTSSSKLTATQEGTLEPGVTSRMSFGGTDGGELVFVLKDNKPVTKSILKKADEKEQGEERLTTPRRSTTVVAPESPFNTMSPPLMTTGIDTTIEEEEITTTTTTTTTTTPKEKKAKKTLSSKKKTKSRRMVKADENDIKRLTNFLAQQEAEREDKNTVDTTACHILADEVEASSSQLDDNHDGKPAWAHRKLRTTAKGELLKQGVNNLANPITPERMPVRHGE